MAAKFAHELELMPLFVVLGLMKRYDEDFKANRSCVCHEISCGLRFPEKNIANSDSNRLHSVKSSHENAEVFFGLREITGLGMHVSMFFFVS